MYRITTERITADTKFPFDPDPPDSLHRLGEWRIVSTAAVISSTVGSVSPSDGRMNTGALYTILYITWEHVL